MGVPFELIPISKKTEMEIVSLDRGIVSIGRDVDNDILVDNESMSRRHAALIPVGQEWVFVDQGSTNGSWVNDIRRLPGQFMLLRHGDIVKLANVTFRFALKYPSQINPTKRSLLIFSGEAFEREVIFPSDGSEFVIGTRSGDIALDEESEEDQSVAVFLGSKGLEIEAYSSLIQVLIDGQPVSGKCLLHDRQILAIGIYSLLVVDNLGANVKANKNRDLLDSNVEKTASQVNSASISVKGWDEPNNSSGPFIEREESFKQTIALKSGSRVAFGHLAEDDPTNAYHLLQKSSDAERNEADPLQIILGVVLVLVFLAVVLYSFFLL